MRLRRLFNVEPSSTIEVATAATARFS